MDILNSESESILRHMLGARQDIKKTNWGYRNYIAVDSKSSDKIILDQMVMKGLAVRGITGKHLTFYHATEAGMDAIKLTEAQKRRSLR